MSRIAILVNVGNIRTEDELRGVIEEMHRVSVINDCEVAYHAHYPEINFSYPIIVKPTDDIEDVFQETKKRSKL